MAVTGPRFYRIRLTRRGPWCPCKFWYGPPSDPVTGEMLDRSPRWHVLVNEAFVEPFSILIQIGDHEPTVIGEPISESEYEFLIKDRAWCRDYAPSSPEANPHRAIDMNQLPPIKFA